MQSKEKQELRKKLQKIGLSKKTSQKYSEGYWSVPLSIKQRIKENEIKN